MGRARIAALTLVAGALAPATAHARPLATGFDNRPVLIHAEPKPAKPKPPKLPVGRTVKGAIKRAILTKKIDPLLGGAWIELDANARKHAGGELAAVLNTLDGLAADRELTISRLPVAMRMLAHNLTPPTVPPGGRIIDHDIVYQHFAGHGMAVHMLATAGHANALAGACLKQLAKCPKRRVKTALDALLSVSSERAGYRAFEYLVPYGQGRAPWVSGMVQGTAASAFARGARIFGSVAYRHAALESLGAFAQAPPSGIAVRAPGGMHYLMYSFDTGQRILNGDLQSIIGLHDVAHLLGSRRAEQLYERGERAARASVHDFDTGAWSRYSLGGRESDLSYHQLVTGFLRGMCWRTGKGAYCAPAKRFARYETEPPAYQLTVARKPRARDATPIRFAVSKVGSATVTVTGVYRHTTLLRRSFTVSRGSYTVPWSPPAKGTYRVTVSGVGLIGPRGSADQLVRARISRAELERRRIARAKKRAAEARRKRRIAARKRAAARKRRAERRLIALARTS